MKRIIGGFIGGLLLCLSAQANSLTDDAFKNVATIEKEIKRTSFPDKVFNIIDFGAKPDQTEPCHEAINQAIIACNQKGGGVVLIPKGTFLSGPITLKSNVNLHLEEGAFLKFSTDQSLYFPAVITRWEGIDCYNAHPLIYAYGETNIAITGKGTIDGQGSNEAWWYMKGNHGHGWKEGLPNQHKGRETFPDIRQNQAEWSKCLMIRFVRRCSA